MNSEYILRINTDKEKYDILKDLLLVEPTSIKSYWELSIKENSNSYTDAINYFLGLIENNIKELNKNGINNEDISIWYFYEYEEQCNMEFHPMDLKRLGDNGIVLCISCWQR
jgi:hypothetical protein